MDQLKHGYVMEDVERLRLCYCLYWLPKLAVEGNPLRCVFFVVCFFNENTCQIQQSPKKCAFCLGVRTHN